MSKPLLVCENAYRCSDMRCEHRIPHFEKNDCRTQKCGATTYKYPESTCKVVNKKTNLRW